jgi:hypothetical protein
VGAAAALLALAMAACSPADVNNTEASSGSDAGVTDGGPGDASAKADADSGANAACRAEAYARCTKLAGCSQAYLENRFGSVAVCEQVMAGECIAAVNAPGSAQTPAQVELCMAAVTDPNTWSCDDYIFSQNTPPACATPSGALANGASCLVSAQCQSTFCNVPVGSSCGVCAPPLQLHDSCATSNCPASLVCESTTKTCETYSQLGASCGSAAPCAVGLTCTAGSNGSTCQTGVATSGAGCVFSGPGCSFAAGFACNIESSTCQQVQFAAPSGACGVVSGQQAYCSGGACIFGNCVPYGLPGQPCSMTSTSAGCINGARCITTGDGGTSGTCQVIGAGSCP